MIEVAQRQLWRADDHPDGPQRGDCLRACVASVWDLPYEAVPDFGEMNQVVNDWLKTFAPGVRAPYQYLGKTWAEPETLDSWKSWPTSAHHDGYWIATVYSHRIPDVESFGCGCGSDPSCEWCGGKPETRSMGIIWGLHAVVMRGGRCAWDPHPDRERGFGPFRGATTFRLVDPPAFAAALRGAGA